MAPSYEIPSGNYTFYYMELALEGKLTRKVQQFKVKAFMIFNTLKQACIFLSNLPTEKTAKKI